MIWIVGAGAVGSVLAARLQTDPPCRLIDGWAEHVNAIRSSGLHVDFPDESVAVSVPAFHLGELDELDETPEIVLLAVKATSTTEVVKQLLPHLAPTSVVVSLQNGVNEEQIAKLVGVERTIGAVVRYGGELLAPGRARGYSMNSGLVIGELNGTISVRVQSLAATLAASAPVEVSANIWGELWSKLIVNAQINPVCALTGLRTDEVAADPIARRIGTILACEAIAVALRQHMSLRPEVLDLDPSTYDSDLDRDALHEAERAYTARWSKASVKPSMLQDAEKGRATEIDALNGHVVAKGRALGVPVPVSEAVVELVHAAEAAGRPPRRDALRPLAERWAPMPARDSASTGPRRGTIP